MYLIIIELANACIYHPYWWNSQWFWDEKDENRFLSIDFVSTLIQYHLYLHLC